jgi:hypothetical protein
VTFSSIHITYFDYIYSLFPSLIPLLPPLPGSLPHPS